MKRLITLLLILAIGGACALFFTTQVYSSTSYVKSFEKFIIELEQKETLSDVEYAEVKKEFIDYSEIYYEKYKAKLTDDEKSMILDLKRRYYVTLASIGSEEIINDIKGIASKATELFKQLFEQ